MSISIRSFACKWLWLFLKLNYQFLNVVKLLRREINLRSKNRLALLKIIPIINGKHRSVSGFVWILKTKTTTFLKPFRRLLLKNIYVIILRQSQYSCRCFTITMANYNEYFKRPQLVGKVLVHHFLGKAWVKI